MIKLSEKAKIILAVIAVAVVAAGAVTYVALSSNANNVQSDLSVNGGRNGVSALAAGDDFSIVVDAYNDINNEYTGTKWSTDINNPAEIGVAGAGTVSYFVTGESFGGVDTAISYSQINADGSLIGESVTLDDPWNDSIVTDLAGLYCAEVTVDSQVFRLYAKVIKPAQSEKTVLEVKLTFPQASLKYTGNKIEGIELRATNSTESIDELVNWDVSFADYYTGGTSKNGITVQTDGMFDVTCAGRYTVTLNLTDYGKEAYKFENNSDTYELKFEVERALVSGSVKYNSDYSNNLTAEQLLGEIEFTPSTAAGNDQTGKYALNYSLYDDAGYGTPLTELSVGKDVFVKAAIAPYSQGDDTYLNYRLPAQGETGFDSFVQFSFKLTAPALAAPSVSVSYYGVDLASQIGFPIIQDAGVSAPGDRTVIYATYLNFGYKVSQWFYGSHDLWTDTSSKGYNRGENWNVTVSQDGGTPETVDPNTYEMKNAGTYVVIITPKEGFRFADKDEYAITLIISPFTLASGHILWESDTKHIYDGNPVNFGREDYQINLPELLSADNDKLVLEIERIKIELIDGGSISTVIDEAPINAGTYTYRVKANGIKGEVASNYKLSVAEINNSTSPFKIYKQELPNYSGTPLITGKFNGTEQVIDMAQALVDKGLAVLGTSADGSEEYIPNIIKLDQSNFNSNIVHSYPISWGVSGSYTVTASLEVGRNFRFTRAGSYSVTFMLPTDSDFGVNYCWYGDSNEPGSDSSNYVWENFILIERAEIDPSLSALSISVNDEVIDLEDHAAQAFKNIAADNPYVLTFGSGSETKAYQFDFETVGGAKKYKAGEYYLLIDLDENLYPDCIFNKASADAGNYKIQNDGKRVRIEYSVNSNTVSISYTVSDYVFGDNLADSFGVNNVFTFDKRTVEGATVTFGEPTYEFYTDEQRTQGATLHNGLPRNAGTYYFKITINYTVNGENSVWARNGELNVEKRPISAFVWTLDGEQTSQLSASFSYNGSAHTVSVAASLDKTYLPAVGVDLSGVSATDVGNYTFNITGLTGDDADNYKYDGLTNVSFNVVITPAQVAVTANNFADIKFGQAFNFDENAFAVSGSAKDLFESENLNVNLSLAVYFVGGSSLTLVTEYGSLGCGQYLVIPVYSGKDVPATLTDNKYVVTVDNYELTMTADGFSVTAEELIVTLYGGSSSVYGDPVNLYIPRNGDAGIYETNLTLSEEEFKRAVNLTATTPTGGASATADKANAGTYRLRAALTEYGQTNYSIKVKFVGENGNTSVANYYITRRKVTLETNDVIGNIYGNGYNYVNNVYNITSGNILDSDKNGLNIYCGVFVYNGQFNHKTGELSNLSVGEYYHFATFSGAVGDRLQREDGKYYTVANVGNYEVTSIASKYEIAPRQITLTFTDGSSVYGDNIDLWKRQSNYSETDQRYYSTYDYCQAVNLRFDSGDLVNLTDSLKDVITLSLVKDGNVVLTGNGVCNAGTYQYKAAIKEDNPNYVIVDGTNGGREFIGGQFVVSPKSITIQTTASKTSVSYGDGLTGVTLDFTVSELASGDEKSGLNLTVAIYDGDYKIENVAEYGVGNYVVGVDVSNINPNYVIAENGITTASFTIAKRTLTLTFTENGASSQYGETVTNDMLYAAEIGTLSNLVNGHTYANAVSLSATNGGVDVTAANASAGTYVINVELNSGYSDNYELTVSGHGKYVITPRKVVLKPEAVNHSYKADYDATSPKYVVAEGSFASSADEIAMQIVAVVTNQAGQTVTDSIASQPVGDYVLKLAVTNANPNYDVDVTTYTAAFTIIVRKATVTFKSNPAPSNVYGEPINLDELRNSIRDNALFTINGLLNGDENNVEISIVKRDDENVSATDKYAPVGDYVIIVTLGGNYDVEYVNWKYDLNKGEYAVNKRSVKLAANDVSLVYGNDLASALSYKVAADSLYQPLENDDLDVTLAVFDGTDEISNVATQKVGNYFIKIDKSAANANYAIEVVDVNFVITQATIKLAAKPHSVTYGNDLSLSGNWYTASSDNTTQATITAYLTANAVTCETNYVKGITNANATGVVITPKCASDDNVAIAVEAAAVTVNKRIITLTFTSDGGTSVYGQNVDLYDVSVGALAANDLVGTDEYDGVITLTARINGQTMAERNYAVGTYAITATIANDNYIFADDATTAVSTGKYVITPAAISWTGSVDADKTYTYSGNAYAVDDVSAKLNFTVVKPELNNVTIEYLAYEAGHVCDGTLPWSNAATTVPSYTDAGTYTVYVRFVAANHNTAYLLAPLTLTINKGVLTITAKPHSVTYGNDLTLSDVWYTATSDTITETAIAAYLANHAVSYTTNYDKATTQANESGIIITPSCSGDDNVQVNAVNGAVTVNKRAITVNYITDKFSVYGDSIVDKAELYELTEGSLVNASDVSVTVLLNGEEASSTSSAGTYVVSVTANGNYEVAYFNDIRSGAYVIKPRPVNVSLVNNSVVYTEEEVDGVVKYNGGQYGKTQNAAVNFDGVIAADTFAEGDDYTVTYTLNGAAAVPNKAGMYYVAVELKNGNYVLEGVSTFEYEIVKKQIASSTFMWEDPTLIVDEENKGEFINKVKSYVSEILQISENGFTVKVGADEPVVIAQGDKDTFNTYYYENGQLHVCIKIGDTQHPYIYTVVFGFNSDAQQNYELIGDEVQDGLIERSFSVSSKAVIAILKQQNWQYSDELIAPNTATMIDGALYVPIDQDRVVIRYAPVIDGQAAKDLVGDGNGYDFDEVKHLFADGSLSETFSDFDVGYYIVCVTYNGIVKDQSGNTEYVAIRRFDVFEITKKQLSLPRTLESDVFDGGDKLVEVNFDMTCSDGTTVDINDLVTAEFNNRTIVKGDSIRGKNAGTYTVTFEIKDKDRYVWTDAMEAVDGKAKVTWTIEKDSKEHTDSNPYITIGEIKAVTYGNDVAKSLAEAKAGYSGAFTWYFALKGGETDASKITEWKAWTDGKQPTQAGDYFVKVVLSDGNKNFTDKTAYDEFTINKATLRITISGGLEYGHLFAQTDCNYNIVKSDLIPGDNVSVVNGSVSYYYLVDDNEDELTISGFLDAKEYNLSVARDVNGHVYGLTADNYDIVLAELGKFTVTVKRITVVINANGASSQYGLEPDLTGVTATYTGVDSEEVIREVLSPDNLYTTATSTSGVGNGYVISSRYDTNNENKNLEITYTVAYYTITSRKIYIELDASAAGGTYQGKIGEVTIAAVKDENGVDVSALVGNDYLTVTYDGTAFDGTAFAGNDTHAGNFTATVVGDENNTNFELVDAPTVNFTVEKLALDESLIKATPEQKVYTGEAIEPVLNDAHSGLYNVLSHDPFKAVGKYIIQIQLKDAYNYKWTESSTDIAEVAFEIVKAGIKVVPSGSITYGQTFDNAELSYKLYYVESGELVEEGVVTVDEELISYFVNDVNYNAAKPAAGKYALEMGKTSEGSDFVNGFTSPNFKIVLEVGKFEVKKRDIEITVNNSSSIYSQSITLNNGFEVTSGELVWEEDKDAVINFTITANPANWTNAGSDYIVTATATADNYNIVKVNGGKHTIKQLEVTVTITATDGVYFDKTVNVTTSQTGNIDYDFGRDFAANYVFKYTNTATGAESNLKPSNAGSYRVTVTGINDGNFKLVSVTDATFAIAKKVVDQDDIAVKQGAVYNGQNQSHGIIAVEGVYSVSGGDYVNADSYTVTLTLTDSDNYSWKNTSEVTVTKQFVISQAPLTLKPNGQITYGDDFAANTHKYGYELIGLTDADKNKDYSEIVTGNVTYVLADENVKLNASDAGYDMIAHIDGLTCQNYRITAETGKLIVNKRDITIKPYASQSYYGEEVILSRDFIDVNNRIVAGDSKADFNYVPSTAANPSSDVNKYEITATASNSNYNITFDKEYHVIVAAKVGVRIRPINGIYGDDGNLGGIEFMSVVVIKSNGRTEDINNLQFTVIYEGIANDKSSYRGSEVPTKAGVYTATVTSVSNNKNYVLDATYGDVDTVLVIEKCQIDADKIKATSASYTGKAVIPHIEDSLYNVNGRKVYNTIFEGSLINVGTYGLTLSLIDTNNYAWVNNLNRTATIKFEIVKADNSLVDASNPETPDDSIKVEIPNWTFGETASKPQAEVANGEIVFEYATSENGAYTTEVPRNAGEYWVRATVAESDSYNAFVSKATKFVINKKAVDLPVAANLSGNSVYTGSMLALIVDGFDDQIMSLKLDSGMYRSDVNGKLNLLALNAGTYQATFKLRNNDNYVWADDSQLVDGAVVVNWTVERQIIKRLPDATSKILVNGEDIVFIPEGFNSGIMTIESNVRAHEGNFSAIVTLKDTANYAWEGTDSASIAVNFELTGTNTVFIAAICVVAGLSVGLAVMAVILTLVNRRKKRKEAEAIDARSRADGWEGDE